ncbi:MAG TPA: hypothetical protein VK171_11560 [Fimbriimonas sp.]|nr:hypothetical protein [Fimbriimonas sp.]
MAADETVVSNYPREVAEPLQIQREVGLALADLFVAFRSCVWMPTGMIVIPGIVFFLVNVLGGIFALAFVFGVLYAFGSGMVAIFKLAKLRRGVFGRPLLLLPAMLLCSVPFVGIIPSILIARYLFLQLREFGVHGNSRQYREEIYEAVSERRPAAIEA